MSISGGASTTSGKPSRSIWSLCCARLQAAQGQRQHTAAKHAATLVAICDQHESAGALSVDFAADRVREEDDVRGCCCPSVVWGWETTKIAWQVQQCRQQE